MHFLLRISHAAAAFSLLVCISGVHAADWATARVCVDLLNCSENIAALSKEEQGMLKNLTSGLKVGMSLNDVTAFFGHAPYANVPETKAWSGPPGRVISGADWAFPGKTGNSGKPNVSVTFENGKLVSFRWIVQVPGLRVTVYQSL